MTHAKHALTSGNRLRWLLTVAAVTGAALTTAAPAAAHTGFTGTRAGAVSPDQAMTSTSLTANPSSATTNQSVTLTATVTNSSGATAPAGDVTFYNGSSAISPCIKEGVTAGANGSATATCTTSFAAGTQSLSADFASTSSSFDSSSSPAVSYTVGQEATTTALMVSSTTPRPGDTLTYTASVTPTTAGPVSPFESVNFTDNGSSIRGCDSVATTVDNEAICQTSYANGGTHSIVAHYSGDANFTGSVSSAVTVTVAPLGLTSTGRAHVKGTKASVTISCSGGTLCTSDLSLSVREALHGKKVVNIKPDAREIAAHAAFETKHTHRTLQIGSSKWTIGLNGTKTVSVSLNRTGRNLLAKYHKLTVLLTISQGPPALKPNTVTRIVVFRAKKK